MKKHELSETYDILRLMAKCIGESKYYEHIIFKGATALNAILIQEGRKELMRETRDIDLQVDHFKNWERFVNELETMLNGRGVLFIIDNVTSKNNEYGRINLRAFKNDSEYKLKIDMNIDKKESIPTVIIESLRVRAYSLEAMLADKISAAYSQKIFRRIKDLYDIAAISKVKYFISDDIIDIMERKRPETFDTAIDMIIPENYDMLYHAFIKNSGIRDKIEFSEMCNTVRTFCTPILNRHRGLIWKEWWFEND